MRKNDNKDSTKRVNKMVDTIKKENEAKLSSE